MQPASKEQHAGVLAKGGGMGLSARAVVVSALALALALVSARAAVRSDQAFPKPTVQEGPVEVRGTVNVGNAPVVEAKQSGAWGIESKQSGTWSVRVQQGSAVSIGTPSFLEINGTYEFRWSNDRTETYRIVQLTPARREAADSSPSAPGGWVLAEPVGGELKGRRYLNVAQAISIMPAQR